MNTDRYSRQIRFVPIGEGGQQRLAASRVLIVGVGALGTHAANILARAGVGHITVVDRDIVELDNLQRQILFEEPDVGQPKAVVAAETLRRVNSSIEVESVVADFEPATFDELPERPTLILDGTDNFATRYTINDLAIREGLPWIYAAAIGSTGRAMAIEPGVTPCLRCLMPAPPPATEIGTCETDGILAATIATVTAFQTTEAIRRLATDEPFTRGVFECDAWHHTTNLRLRDCSPRGDCASCGTGELPGLIRDRVTETPMCGRNAVQVRPKHAGSLDFDRLEKQLETCARSLDRTPQMLRFEVEDANFTVFRSGRALVAGTDDTKRARILYDRYVGL